MGRRGGAGGYLRTIEPHSPLRSIGSTLKRVTNVIGMSESE
jgi:hypothetical protein